MKARILLDNVWGRVEERSLVPQLRRLVAYQPVPLPPVDAQRTIKAWFARHGRRGRDDLDRLREAEAETLTDQGLDWATFAKPTLETVLRQSGVYDGWVAKMDRLGRFPAGLLYHVQRALWRLGVDYEVQDVRTPCRTPEPVGEVPPLFSYQEEAVQAVLKHHRGVVYLPPRAGKTRIAIALLAKLGLPTLYVTPRRELVRQTVESMRQWLPEDAVVPVTGGKAALGARKRRMLPSQLIWVATPGTAVKLPGMRSRRVLITDEFHHAAATQYQQISEACDAAFWRVGLTGTFYRADNADMEMHGVLAHAIYRKSVCDMVALGRLVPASIAMLRVGGRVGDSDYYRDGVTANANRNGLIAWVVAWLASQHRRTLVLTKEIAHAEALGELIPGSIQVDGRDSSRVRSALDDLEAHRTPAVIGTSVIGEGVDVPAADALVYAAAGKSRVKVVQDTFRVLTASPGKSRALIIDFADEHNEVLLKQAAQRLAIYRSEPAHAATVLDPGQFPAWMKEEKA